MKQVILIAALNLIALISYALTGSVPAEHPSYKAVVHIAIPAWDPTDGSPVTGYCNGTFIAKNKIVTAAHCVVSSYLFKGQPLKIELGEYRYKQTPSGNIRTGYYPFLRHATPVTVVLRPGVNPNSPPNKIPPENDYAILTLQNEAPLPADFVFPTIWNQGLIVTMVSQSFVVTVNPIAYVTSNDTKQTASLSQVQYLDYLAKSTSGSRVEEGDSGAPLFVVIQGKTYLAGVVKGRARTGFSNYDVFAIWSSRFQP